MLRKRKQGWYKLTIQEQIERPHLYWFWSGKGIKKILKKHRQMQLGELIPIEKDVKILQEKLLISHECEPIRIQNNLKKKLNNFEKEECSFIPINIIKSSWISYKGKQNVKWEIKWDPDDNIFTFFLYVWEEEGIRVYRELIPNEILGATLGDIQKINDVVETCIDKLNKLNNKNFRDH